jgi:hypothetical protein
MQHYIKRGRRGRDRMVQSVTITTKIVSSNSSHGDAYSLQLYMIKFVSDLRQFCGFIWVHLYSGFLHH